MIKLTSKIICTVVMVTGTKPRDDNEYEDGVLLLPILVGHTQ